MIDTHEILLERTFSGVAAASGGFLPPLPEGVQALMAGALAAGGADVWFLHEDRQQLRQVYALVRQWLPAEDVHWFYPHNIRDVPVGEEPLLPPLWLAERLVRPGRGAAVIFSHPTLADVRFPDPEAVRAAAMRLQKGEEVDPEMLADFLTDDGYVRVDFADRPGTYAWRGMIFDVFPYHAERPVRIEYDDDRIADLRRYDAETQLSEGPVSEVVITGSEALRGGAALPLTAFLRGGRKIFAVEPRYWPAVSAEDLSLAAPFFTVGAVPAGEKPLGVPFEVLPPFNRNIDRFVRALETYAAAGFRVLLASPLKEDHARIRELLDLRGVDVPFSFFPHAFPVGLKLPADRTVIIPYRWVLPSGGKKRKVRQVSPVLDIHQLAPGDHVVHVDYGVGVFEGITKMDFKGQMREVLRIRYAGGDLLFVGISSMHKLSPYAPPTDGALKLHKLGSGRWKRLRERAKEKIKALTIDLIKLYSVRKTQQGHAFSPDGQLMMEVELGFPYVMTPDQQAAWEAIRKDMEGPRPMDRLICGDVGFGKTELALRAAAKAVADGKQVAVLVPTTVLALQHYKTFRQRLQSVGVRVEYVCRFRTSAEIRRVLKALAAGKVDILIGTHRLLSDDVRFLDLGLLVIDEEQRFGVGAKEKLRALKTNVDTLALTATPIPRTLQFSLLGIRDISVLNTPPPGRKPVETVVENFHPDVLQRVIRREMDRGGQVFFIHNRIRDLEMYAEMIRRRVPQARVGIAHGQMDPGRLEEMMYFFVEGRYNVLVTTSLVESGLHIPSANTIIINNAHYFGLSDLHQLRGRVGRSDVQGYCYVFVPSLRALPANARRRLQSLQLHQELGSGFKIAMHDLAIRGAGNLFGPEQSGFVAEMGYETYEKVLLEALEEMQSEGLLPSHAQDTLKLLGRHIRRMAIESDVPAFLPDDYVASAAQRMAFYQRLNEVASEEELRLWMDALRDQYGPLPPPARNLISIVRLRWLLQDIPIEKIIHRERTVRWYLSGHDPGFYQSAQFDRLLSLLQKEPARCRFSQRGQTPVMLFKGFATLDDFAGWFRDFWHGRR